MQAALRGFLLVTLTVASHANSQSGNSYIAAVVEYRPITEGEDARKVAEKNAARVETIVKKAAEYNADIIVFPETGITSLPIQRNWTIERIRAHYNYAASYVPKPEEQAVLCDDASGKYREALKNISCTAKKYRLYLVVNHHERVDCHHEANCPDDGVLLYNSNVVFDRKGRVVARYRKYNLFSEPGINITPSPEVSLFETDFGVTFGQIICNDILYLQPTLDILKNHNVTNIVFSAEWFSELPFLTSVQTHSAWALANDVVLLSSGFNEPAITNGGSGIYFGRRGVLKATLPTDSANVLIVAEVSKFPNTSRQNLTSGMMPQVYKFSQTELPTTWDSTEKFMYKDDFSVYTTEIVEQSQIKKLCNRGLCCNFKIDLSFNEKLINNKQDKVDYYRYRIGVFNGTRLFAGEFTVGIEVCGLFFCRNNSLASCGDRFPSNVNVLHPTRFNSIVIERVQDDDSQKFYLPMTLTKNLLPIDASKISYGFVKNEESVLKTLRMALTSQEDYLMTFAIYGRNLARDGSELTT